MMKSAEDEIQARSQLAGSNQFELLLFRLGESRTGGQRELFGINVFKVREVLVLPHITELAQARDENESLQLTLMEQEEKQGATAARIQALVERASPVSA